MWKQCACKQVCDTFIYEKKKEISDESGKPESFWFLVLEMCHEEMG